MSIKQQGVCKEWDTWVENKFEYQESIKLLNKYISLIKDIDDRTNDEVVDLSIARAMKRDLKESLKKVESLVLYHFTQLQEKELTRLKLTDNQILIARLRNDGNSFREIAMKLKLDQANVFRSYCTVIKKLEKFRRNNYQVELSSKQKEIYDLYYIQNKSKSQVANILNITPNTLKTHLRRIGQKVGGVTKNNNN